MKKILHLFIVLFVLTAEKSFPQIDDILKKIPGVDDVLIEKAVTTSIKNAYPTAYWLKDLDEQVDLITGESFRPDIQPGYYKFSFKTFCLHAGTYAPTEGAGYLVAPLKGAKAKLIKNVLTRYTEHPEIEQKDVQLLIWGIQANAKFSGYPVDFQTRVAPLLTPDEIALMEVDVKDIAMDLLPQEVKDVLNLYSNMRQKLSDVNSTYEDVERLAVRTGIAPIGKGSRNIDAGTWSSVGDGVYIRCFPHGYSQSDVEVYIPSDVEVKRDNKNRITSLSDASNSIEFTYDDSPGGNALDGKYPIYRFKSVSISGEETLTINDRGWYIPSITKVSGAYSRSDDPTLQDYNDRKKAGEDFIKSVKKSVSKKKLKKFKNNNLKELKQLELSLKTLLEINEISGDPAEKTYKLAVDALNIYAADVVSGHKKGGAKTKLTGVDMSAFVFTPANTSNQMLGGGPGGPSSGNEGEKEKEKKKDCKVSAVIHQANESELPKPDWVYTVNVDVFIEGEDECNAEEILFTLYDVSKERGRCLNDKEKYDDVEPDLQFSDLNQGYEITQTTAKKQISGKSQSQQVYIWCRDYGAFGKLKVSVKAKGQWYEADADGAPDKFITIPLDINDNKIADSWEKQNNVYGMSPDWDEDPDPKGQAKTGDGMTNYEEYRGFFVSDGSGGVEYLRMNPKMKELFVIDDSYFLSKISWEKASGIKLYYMTAAQVYGEKAGGDVDFKYRWVNFCRGHAQGLKYTLNIIKVDGLKDPYNMYPDPEKAFAYSDYGPPKSCKRVVVFPDRVRLSVDKMLDEIKKTLESNPNKKVITFKKFKFARKSLQELVDKMNDLDKYQAFIDYQMTLSVLHEVGHACAVKHHGGGKSGFEGSGDINCPMRYINVSDQVKWLKVLANVFKIIDEEGLIPLVDYTNWKFCKKKDNCWKQLNVNDR